MLKPGTAEVNCDANLYSVCTVASLHEGSGFVSDSNLFMWSLDRYITLFHHLLEHLLKQFHS